MHSAHTHTNTNGLIATLEGLLTQAVTCQELFVQAHPGIHRCMKLTFTNFTCM